MKILGENDNTPSGYIQVFEDTENGNIVYVTPNRITAVSIHDNNTNK